MRIRNRALQMGKMWEAFNKFILSIETGKTFIWFSPKYVMMDWESYRKLSGAKNGHTIKHIVFDEVVNTRLMDKKKAI